jgi:hypothetical protein
VAQFIIGPIMVFALLFALDELEAYSIATTPVPLAPFEDEAAVTTTEPPVIAAISQGLNLRAETLSRSLELGRTVVAKSAICFVLKIQFEAPNKNIST